MRRFRRPGDPAFVVRPPFIPHLGLYAGPGFIPSQRPPPPPPPWGIAETQGQWNRRESHGPRHRKENYNAVVPPQHDGQGSKKEILGTSSTQENQVLGNLEEFYCNNCKVQCNGPVTFKLHCEGNRHKRGLNGKDGYESLSNEGTRGNRSRTHRDHDYQVVEPVASSLEEYLQGNTPGSGEIKNDQELNSATSLSSQNAADRSVSRKNYSHRAHTANVTDEDQGGGRPNWLSKSMDNISLAEREKSSKRYADNQTSLMSHSLHEDPNNHSQSLGLRKRANNENSFNGMKRSTSVVFDELMKSGDTKFKNLNKEGGIKDLICEVVEVVIEKLKNEGEIRTFQKSPHGFPWTCVYCNVTCNGEKTKRRHLLGKRHRREQAERSKSYGEIEATSNERFIKNSEEHGPTFEEMYDAEISELSDDTSEYEEEEILPIQQGLGYPVHQQIHKATSLNILPLHLASETILGIPRENQFSSNKSERKTLSLSHESIQTSSYYSKQRGQLSFNTNDQMVLFSKVEGPQSKVENLQSHEINEPMLRFEKEADKAMHSDNLIENKFQVHCNEEDRASNVLNVGDYDSQTPRLHKKGTLLNFKYENHVLDFCEENKIEQPCNQKEESEDHLEDTKQETNNSLHCKHNDNLINKVKEETSLSFNGNKPDDKECSNLEVVKNERIQSLSGDPACSQHDKEVPLHVKEEDRHGSSRNETSGNVLICASTNQLENQVKQLPHCAEQTKHSINEEQVPQLSPSGKNHIHEKGQNAEVAKDGTMQSDSRKRNEETDREMLHLNQPNLTLPKKEAMQTPANAMESIHTTSQEQEVCQLHQKVQPCSNSVEDDRKQETHHLLEISEKNLCLSGNFHDNSNCHTQKYTAIHHLNTSQCEEGIEEKHNHTAANMSCLGQENISSEECGKYNEDKVLQSNIPSVHLNPVKRNINITVVSSKRSETTDCIAGDTKEAKPCNSSWNNQTQKKLEIPSQRLLNESSENFGSSHAADGQDFASTNTKNNLESYLEQPVENSHKDSHDRSLMMTGFKDRQYLIPHITIKTEDTVQDFHNMQEEDCEFTIKTDGANGIQTHRIIHESLPNKNLEQKFRDSDSLRKTCEKDDLQSTDSAVNSVLATNKNSQAELKTHQATPTNISGTCKELLKDTSKYHLTVPNESWNTNSNETFPTKSHFIATTKENVQQISSEIKSEHYQETIEDDNDGLAKPRLQILRSGKAETEQNHSINKQEPGSSQAMSNAKKDQNVNNETLAHPEDSPKDTVLQQPTFIQKEHSLLTDAVHSLDKNDLMEGDKSIGDIELSNENIPRSNICEHAMQKDNKKHVFDSSNQTSDHYAHHLNKENDAMKTTISAFIERPTSLTDSKELKEFEACFRQMSFEQRADLLKKLACIEEKVVDKPIGGMYLLTDHPSQMVSSYTQTTNGFEEQQGEGMCEEGLELLAAAESSGLYPELELEEDLRNSASCRLEKQEMSEGSLLSTASELFDKNGKTDASGISAMEVCKSQNKLEGASDNTCHETPHTPEVGTCMFESRYGVRNKTPPAKLLANKSDPFNNSILQNECNFQESLQLRCQSCDVLCKGEDMLYFHVNSEEHKKNIILLSAALNSESPENATGASEKFFQSHICMDKSHCHENQEGTTNSEEASSKMYMQNSDFQNRFNNSETSPERPVSMQTEVTNCIASSFDVSNGSINLQSSLASMTTKPQGFPGTLPKPKLHDISLSKWNCASRANKAMYNETFYPAAQSFSCDLCKKEGLSLTTYQAHLRGKVHLRNQRRHSCGFKCDSHICRLCNKTPETYQRHETWLHRNQFGTDSTTHREGSECCQDESVNECKASRKFEVNEHKYACQAQREHVLHRNAFSSRPSMPNLQMHNFNRHMLEQHQFQLTYQQKLLALMKCLQQPANVLAMAQLGILK